MSGGNCCLRKGIVGRLESLSEAGAERPVVDSTADLQQQIGPSSRPAHLLRLVHPPVDQEVGRPFGHRGSDPQAGTISLGVIDEPVALAAEIVVDLVQRVPQLAGWHACPSDDRVRP